MKCTAYDKYGEEFSNYVEKRFLKFQSYVDKRNDDECWNWKKKLDCKGYGSFTLLWKDENENFHSYTGSASRFSYCIEHDIDILILGVNKEVIHSCDNSACCNPKHLRIGTTEENVQDRHSRGRTRNKYTVSNSKIGVSRYLQFRLVCVTILVAQSAYLTKLVKGVTK